MLDDWMDELENLRTTETHAFKRRTYIARRQHKLQAVYEGALVQYIVAVLIVSNFLVEAFRWRSRITVLISTLLFCIVH
jgi:hypothetical protein